MQFLRALAAMALALMASPARSTDPEACSAVSFQDRKACGSRGIGREACEERGCCWQRNFFPSIPSCFKNPTNHLDITCPFLSTLVNEGVLPVKPSYTMEELADVTLRSGLSEFLTNIHIPGNFVHNPSGVQDIFNMEGAANEHITSTGAHDCATFFYDCREDANGIGTCKNVTEDCILPNVDRFEEFFRYTDTNEDEVVTREELFALDNRYPPINDASPLRRLASIAGSHQLVLEIFGEDNGASMSKEDFRRILIDRRFPVGYSFPAVGQSRTTTSTTTGSTTGSTSSSSSSTSSGNPGKL